MYRLAAILILSFVCTSAYSQAMHAYRGVVLDAKGDAVVGAKVSAWCSGHKAQTVTDQQGRFEFSLPADRVTIRIEGDSIVPQQKEVSQANARWVVFTIQYAISPVKESIVIAATAVDPAIDRRNDAVYKNTLFNRDDQIFDTLAAGINAGQHEGGGKSIEVRRFGYNLDHGGVSGGLKVLVDNVQQNQGTQGHGQGYLGQLKSLTPELVEDVDILNGPFRAEYGDFSGLGVVHIRLKEKLNDRFTARIQGGSFGAYRTFLAYSPRWEDSDSFFAYEGSRTDGPFKNPLRYKRDNLTVNYTRHLSASEALGIRLNGARNDFDSSGQIPLDEVAGGRLDRFGFVDPFNGGKNQNATVGLYYKKDFPRGDTLKIDGFVSRNLFDLWSNFTFYLNDPLNGDEIQQHDSRLQEGANVQWLRPWKFFGHSSLLTVGGNFHDNQINVGRFHTVAKQVIHSESSADAHVTNTGWYAQQGFDFEHPRVHLDVGLRYDVFRFAVADQLGELLNGTQSAVGCSLS